MQHLVDRLVRPEILALTAYQVPDATGLIKLDAMENPYGLPEGLRQEWLEVLARGDVYRYPGRQGPHLARPWASRRTWPCCWATAPTRSSRCCA